MSLINLHREEGRLLLFNIVWICLSIIINYFQVLK